MFAKTQLSDAELAYLTEVDGHDHVAIGAVTQDESGHEQGVAIARFIRSPDDPRAAEAAIAVVDDWQRKGLGTLLLLRLVAAARERGIDRFTGVALCSNDTIRDILARLPSGVTTRSAGRDLFVSVELPAVPVDEPAATDERQTSLGSLFSLIARGLVVVRRLLAAQPDAPPPP
jgi:GNAT superfamily N-acetyltransferase